MKSLGGVGISNIKTKWDVDIFTNCVKDSTTGKIKIPQSKFKTKGQYPIIDQGANFIAGYTDNQEKVYKGDLPVIIFGDHTRIFKYIDFPFATGADGVKILTPDRNRLITKYLYYFLKSIFIRSHGYSRHYKFLKEKRVSIPPKDVQERIITLFNKAEQLRDWRKQSDKLTNNYLNSVFHRMFGKNPKLPVKCLKELTTLITKGESPLWKGIKYQKQGIPIIRIKNIRNLKISLEDAEYISEKTHKQMKRSQLQKNDLVISIAGTLGRCAIVSSEVLPANMNQDQALVRLKNEIVDPEYVLHALNSRTIKEQIANIKRGATRLHLNLKQVGDLKIPLPSKDEQIKFVILAKSIEKLKQQQIASSLEINRFNEVITGKIFG